MLALGGWSHHGLLTCIVVIRGVFALEQALYAVRDGGEEEHAGGLADCH
ncbi:hypothetical protein GCM10017688_40870 [Streptomyces ramulosus]